MDADYNETHEDWASFGLAQELIVKEYRYIACILSVGGSVPVRSDVTVTIIRE